MLLAVVLGLGAYRLLRRGVLVRVLSAQETLGAVDMVITDKTGTLTENQLRVADLRPAEGRDDTALLTAAALASTAHVVEDGATLRYAGDPVDGALVLAAHERGLTHETLHQGRQIVFQPVLQHRTQHFGGHILDRASFDAIENFRKFAEGTGDLRTGSLGNEVERQTALFLGFGQIE